MIPTNKHRDFNVQTPDIKSAVTAFGKHNRVMACLPSYDQEFGCTILYARVDHVNNLPDPTASEIIKVARLDQGVRGKFKLIMQAPDDSGSSTHFYFKPC